jgi:hypothetical protein
VTEAADAASKVERSAVSLSAEQISRDEFLRASPPVLVRQAESRWSAGTSNTLTLGGSPYNRRRNQRVPINGVV